MHATYLDYLGAGSILSSIGISIWVALGGSSMLLALAIVVGAAGVVAMFRAARPSGAEQSDAGK
jgi:hypothetical protein